MTRIGRYEILEALGRGGFATVYKARDTQLNRLVALKVLHEGWSGDPEFVQRFRKEAETAAQFSHPNIVTIYDIGEIERQLFISMEYLPGQNLQQWLDGRGGSLAISEAVDILRPLATALDYAHQQGVVHRDIKPSNVLLKEDEARLQVILTDFGLFKAMENSAVVTRSGQTLGTPEYMAPEQADPNRQDEVGPRTDLYAFGILAYRMLAGRVPFPGNSISTLNAHANLTVPSPEQFNPELSDRVVAVILQMLAKAPSDRYSSAADFISDLQAASEKAAVPVPIPSPSESSEPKPDDEAKRKRPGYVMVFGGLVGVGLLITLIFLAVRGAITGAEDGTPQAAATATTAVATLMPEAEAETTATAETAPSPMATEISLPAEAVDEEPTEAPTLAPSPTPTIDPDLPTVGDSLIRAKDNMVMVYVPAGTFLMGREFTLGPDALDNEFPQHEVTLDGFWIDQTEVTNEQYSLCVQEGNCNESSSANNNNINGDTQPVVGVTWFDAEDYCSWAGGKLPTEAQWEYAARGDDGRLFPWGDEFDGNLVNFCDSNCEWDWKDFDYDDGYAFAAPVGSYPAGASWVNALDMVGNVSEWVQDWYGEDYYETSPGINPTGPESGESRVVRDGPWWNTSLGIRTTLRNGGDPTSDSESLGFRCAASDSDTVSAAPTVESDPEGPPENASLGNTWERPPDNMVMVYVPAGTFLMGSDPERDPEAFNEEMPQHEVTLDGFWIDQTEVTNEQYALCVQDGSCNASTYADDSSLNGDTQPVVGVSWFEAEDYCTWVGGQLPTEAQWEYAARGEDGRLYPWGDEFDRRIVNFCDTDCEYEWKDNAYNDGYPVTAPVGTFPEGASWVNALDMAGNVWEWVADWYRGNYAEDTPELDNKVQRGGSWSQEADYLRSAARSNSNPESSFHSDTGFRCVVTGQ